MRELTPTEEGLINACLRASGMQHETLREELFDHVASLIENRMNEGLSFVEALAETMNDFGEDGLKTVERATLAAVTPSYVALKVITILTGAISAFLLLSGLTFKLLHWPFASLLLVVGATVMVMPFLPLILTLNLISSKNGQQRVFYSLGYVGFSLLALGAAFKIFHWPFATELIHWGSIFLLFGYLPLFFIMKYQRAENRPIVAVTFVVVFSSLLVVFALLPI